jgi:hypothetical protein
MVSFPAHRIKQLTNVSGGHTNTERGFLTHLKSRLLDEFAQEEGLKQTDIDISQTDAHPLIFA